MTRAIGKLGKHPAKRDPRNLRLASFIDRDALYAPPQALDRARDLSSFGRYRNNELGCCVASTWGTIIEVLAGVRVPDDEITRMYSAIGGYDPKRPETDRGASMTTGANYMRQIGMRDAVGKIHRIGAWVQINPHDLTEVQIAMDYLGCLPVGLDLPATARDTSKEWDTTGGGGPEEPGSLGGHSAAKLRFDHRSNGIGTWGFKQGMTLPFWYRYVDECIAPISLDWVTGDKPAPNGFKLDELIAALKALP